MESLEENIKGLREFIKDEDVYQFYKGVIKEYSDEHARKALKNASDKLNRLETETEFGCNEYFVVNDIEDILSEDNLPKHELK